MLAKGRSFQFLMRVCALLLIGLGNSFAQDTTHLSLQQTQFIQSITHHAIIINRSIAQDRSHLNALYKKFTHHIPLTSIDINWICDRADYYNVRLNEDRFQDINDSKIWDNLKERIDTLPVSLIVAQAICESNWGQSRFAREANNYFGQYCYHAGCGIVPKQAANQAFKIRRFSNMQESVKLYMHNINTHYSYTYLRQLRKDARLRGETPSGSLLAQGLSHYAEKPDYTKTIQQIIKQYYLTQYDETLELNRQKEIPLSWATPTYS